MKNIFKSYMKAFIKAWVETLGTIVFLMIFTMLIFGMLSTPLQLSFKASSIKKETNFWQEQWQGGGKLEEEFLYSYIWEDKDFKFNYESMDLKFAGPQGSWITPETKSIVNQYVDDILEDQKTQENIEELKKQETISAVKNLLWFYENYGDKVKTKFFATEQNDNVELEVGNIFTKEAMDEINNKETFSFTNRSVKNYIVYSILDQIEIESKGAFKYEKFMNANIKMKKSNTSSEHFVYNISNATSLSGDDNLNINNVILQKGRMPLKNNEIIVSDSYAKNQNKKIGDKVLLGVDTPYEGSSDLKTGEFTIVGIGLKYSTLTPIGFSSFTDSIKDYGQIFVSDTFFSDEKDNLYEELLQTDYFKVEASTGFQFDKRTEVFISKNDNNYKLNEIFSNLSLESYEQQNTKNNQKLTIMTPGTTMFREPKAHSVIDKLTSLYIITWIYVVIGSILFTLGFMFILFVLKKEINNTRKQLGVFKSLGYTTKELTWVFSLKTFLTMIIGIGIGYLLSFPFQIDSATKQFNSFVVFDYQTIYASPLFLTVLILIVPLLFAGLSYLIIFKFLNEGALSLLTVGPKKSKVDGLVLILKIIFFPALIYSLINWITLTILRKRNKGFTFRMQHAFVSAGKGKFALIMGLFVFSSFLFTLQLRAMPVIKNMIEGGYNIYTKEVNHTYDLSKVIPLKSKDKIVKDVTKEDYGISFTNIDIENSQTVENYIKKAAQEEGSKYQTTVNLTKVLDAASIVRDKWIELNPNASSNEIMENSFKAYSLLIEKAPLNKELTTLRQVTPENMGGIFLNDFGKMACISPFGAGLGVVNPYLGSCSDTEEFKSYLLKLLSAMSGENNLKAGNQNFFPPSSHFFSLLSTFAKMKENVNSFISVNDIIFNGKKESLQTFLSYHIENNSEVDIDHSVIKLIDTTNEYGGDVRSVVNLDSVNEAQLNQLREINPDSVNAIISYRLSKVLNKNIGDTFDIVVGKNIPLTIKVAAINENDTLMQDIYADYETVITKVNGSFNEKNLMFNTLVSTKYASEGTVDLANPAASINSFIYSRDTYTIASSKNTKWLDSIVTPSIMNPESPKATNFFMNSQVITLPILKSVIDQVLGKMTSAMLMYILIDVVLLIILLIVIMNIIITDSINVITIMRSLGYTNGQINWMVMGKYVSGAAISYIFAFIASVGVWKFIQSFVWSKFTVLIALPSLPWIPFVSALILGAILYIGWMAAMLQIKKRPLTLLVS
ncbi:ABC transporter permease [Spiroplasma endosymbiont of Diplazon laetatorius]|uniref:ABC transporter permease n=1 Tax=Spiroplasma endosymbiont of Diplazon laetatorius TaxID=3066322 RepID=UPI0030D53F4E